MFRCSKWSLATLIVKAFNLQPYQFPGRTSLTDNTYEILAKIPTGATAEEFSAIVDSSPIRSPTSLALPDRRVESRTQGAEVTFGTVPLKLIYIVEQCNVGPESCERSKQHRLIALLG
jgi:hypothetical protein